MPQLLLSPAGQDRKAGFYVVKTYLAILSFFYIKYKSGERITSKFFLLPILLIVVLTESIHTKDSKDLYGCNAAFMYNAGHETS